MRDDFKKVYKISLKFLLSLTVRDTFKAIIDEAIKVTGADYGSIFLLKGKNLNKAYTTAPLEFRTQPRKSGYLTQTFQTQRPFILNTKLLRKYHPESNKKIKSIVITPIYYQKKSTGVFTLIFVRKEFRSQKLNTLSFLGSLASLAIRKAQLYNSTKKALEARDLFISTAAHELKTPLTTISVYNELIYDKVSKDSMPDKRWVEGLHSQVFRLTKLINEFLQIDTLKITDLKFEWKKISIRDIIQSSLRNFRIKFPQREIEFRDELGKSRDKIRADYEKILQVINNILDNAVKFSPKKSPITVILTTNSPYISIKVIDKGKGIAKKNMPNIFRKYYKGEVYSKPGMGIGLFLSKRIMDRHHGVINIQSRLNQGTTVEVLLPKIKKRG